MPRLDPLTGLLLQPDSGARTRKNDSYLGHYRQNLENQAGNKFDIQLGKFRKFDNNGVNPPTIPGSIKFGALYNNYAVNDIRHILSEGFSIPEFNDWQTLINYCDGLFSNGIPNKEFNKGAYSLNENNLFYWDELNENITNLYNFNARGGGFRWSFGFNALKFAAHFAYKDLIQEIISSSESYAYFCVSTYFSSDIVQLTFIAGWATNPILQLKTIKSYGISIRGFRLATEEELLLNDGSACAAYVGNDGKIYPTVKIGTQVWIAANIAETKFRNGEWIPGFNGGVYTPISNATWNDLESAAMCFYDDDPGNAYTLTPLLKPEFIGSASLDIRDDGFTASIQINPHGSATRVYLQWSRNPDFFGNEVECTGSPINETGTVEGEVNFLSDVNTWYYRFLARNAAGTTVTQGALLNPVAVDYLIEEDSTDNLIEEDSANKLISED